MRRAVQKPPVLCQRNTYDYTSLPQSERTEPPSQQRIADTTDGLSLDRPQSRRIAGLRLRHPQLAIALQERRRLRRCHRFRVDVAFTVPKGLHVNCLRHISRSLMISRMRSIISARDSF